MKKRTYKAVLLFFLTTSASNGLFSQSAIDNLKPGEWYEVPNSRLDAIDPEDDPAINPNYPNTAPWHAIVGIAGIMDAWCGGAFDSKGNRLLVWGGGHNDYAGNEIYAFNVNTLKWSMLTKPSNPITRDTDQSAPDIAYNPDGTPVSRHTYSYLQYSPETNGFYTFGGAGFYPSGQTGTNHTDCFNLTTMKWEKKADVAGSIGSSSAYDPVTGVCWYRGAWGKSLYSYFTKTDIIKNHGADGVWVNYNVTAAIDPVQRKMVGLGIGDGDGWKPGSNQVISWDISDPNAGAIPAVVLQTTGATEVFGKSNPGFDFDPVLGKLVAWVGGTSVYSLDLTTKVWTKHSPAATNKITPTTPNSNGTYGRFRYVPSKNVFILVNKTSENVYIYKLTNSPLTNIENNISEENITLTASPNPFTGITKIQIPSSLNLKNATLQVLNMHGKLVADLTNLLGEKSIEYHANDLHDGTYIIQLKTDDKIISAKIILSK